MFSKTVMAMSKLFLITDCQHLPLTMDIQFHIIMDGTILGIGIGVLRGDHPGLGVHLGAGDGVHPGHGDRAGTGVGDHLGHGDRAGVLPGDGADITTMPTIVLEAVYPTDQDQTGHPTRGLSVAVL